MKVGTRHLNHAVGTKEFLQLFSMGYCTVVFPGTVNGIKISGWILNSYRRLAIHVDLAKDGYSREADPSGTWSVHLEGTGCSLRSGLTKTQAATLAIALAKSKIPLSRLGWKGLVIDDTLVLDSFRDPIKGKSKDEQLRLAVLRTQRIAILKSIRAVTKNALESLQVET